MIDWKNPFKSHLSFDIICTSCKKQEKWNVYLGHRNVCEARNYCPKLLETGPHHMLIIIHMSAHTWYQWNNNFYSSVPLLRNCVMIRYLFPLHCTKSIKMHSRHVIVLSVWIHRAISSVFSITSGRIFNRNSCPGSYNIIFLERIAIFLFLEALWNIYSDMLKCHHLTAQRDSYYGKEKTKKKKTWFIYIVDKRLIQMYLYLEQLSRLVQPLVLWLTICHNNYIIEKVVG